MTTQITITTDDAALAADLISLINGGGTGTVQASASTPTAAPAVAKKTAAKKAAAPAPVVEDEDVLGGGEEEATADYTMGDAVARATELVGDGQAARVKAALADLGVKKVSELKSDEDINSFVVSLED